MLLCRRIAFGGPRPGTRDEDVSAAETRAGILEELAAEHRDDTRRLRRTSFVAAVVHVILLMVTVPNLSLTPKEVPPKARKIFVVEQVRFQPPPPRPRQARPRDLVKRIPIPDPTPDDPEPLVMDDVPVPEIDLADDLDFDFGIPEAPEGVGAFEGWDHVLEVGGDVVAPVRVYAPQPRYTEEARRARIQGTVILRTVIGENGDVVAIKVLKGLDLGLTESAVETVGTWTYEPATQDGRPVPVYMFVTVNFRLT